MVKTGVLLILLTVSLKVESTRAPGERGAVEQIREAAGQRSLNRVSYIEVAARTPSVWRGALEQPLDAEADLVREHDFGNREFHNDLTLRHVELL